MGVFIFVLLGMVIYDLLPAANAERLHEKVVEIRPVIMFRATVKHRTGTTAAGDPIYGSGFDIIEMDITDRVTSWPALSMTKPRIPGDSTNPIQADTMRIRVMNPDGYFAATADNTIIRPSDIHEGFVRVFANIGTGTPVEFFNGRIQGLPIEGHGYTEFTAISTLWEAIRKPILYENWGVVSGNVQYLYATTRDVLVGAVTITSAGRTFQALHGVATFDASGNATPWAKRSGGGSIGLNQVLIDGTTLRPGVYRIEFLDSENYTVSFPNGAAFTAGNRYQNNQAGNGIRFRSVDWTGTAEAGSVIEFQISLTLYGNPVAIIYYLLERALLQNYGTPIGVTPSVKLDLPAFVTAATRFDGMPVHVTITNKDNAVWQRGKNAKPLNAATEAQRIADHICSSLVMRSDGCISIRTPYIDDSPLWQATTAQHLTDSITIRPTEATYNYLRIQYGYNPATGTYAAEVIGDYREASTEDVIELVVSLPYLPLGVGDRHAEWVRDTIRRRHLRTQIEVDTAAIPQFGLPLLPGDFLRIVSANPGLSQPCEVVRINTEIGSKAKLTLAAIQTPEGPKAEVCVGVVGSVGLW